MPRHAPLPKLTPERQALAERHWRLARYVAGQAARGKRWLADELQSEAYVGLVSAAAQCDLSRPDHETRAFLANGAKMRIQQRLRYEWGCGAARRTRRPPVQTIEDPEVYVQLVGPDPYREVDADDRFAAMLGGLSRRSQHVLSLVYRDGLSLAEVGRSLGYSRERIRQIHDRAIEAIRQTVPAS